MAKYFIVDQDEADNKVNLKETVVEMEGMIAERILEECSLPEEEKDEAFEEALKVPGL